MYVHSNTIEMFALVFGMAFFASTLSGITGFGGGVLMLPPLVAIYGPRPAIVILTLTQVVGNGSRAWFGRDQIDWSVVRLFAAGAVPSAIGGSILFAGISAAWLERLLGVFLLAAVVYRHVRKVPPKMPLWGFLPLGIVFGFLSAILGSVGPFVAPWFLSYGLVKIAYVATEAAASLFMHLTKAAAYGKLSLISMHSAIAGIALSPAMVAGSYVGKLIVHRLPERVFVVLIEVLLVIGGIQFIAAGAFR